MIRVHVWNSSVLIDHLRTVVQQRDNGKLRDGLEFGRDRTSSTDRIPVLSHSTLLNQRVTYFLNVKFKKGVLIKFVQITKYEEISRKNSNFESISQQFKKFINNLTNLFV
jgi:hypothetical protein